MPVADWREVDDAAIARAFDLEARRWGQGLGWDYEPTRRIAEGARQAGTLPGFVVIDDRTGAIAGWTFFLLHQGALQIGALVADRADVIRALLEAVLGSPEASLARRYQVFTFPVNASLDAALERRRFVVEPYRYLARALDSATEEAARPGPVPVSLGDADLPAAARLLARAYAGAPSARAFAPGGRLDEWAHYVGQLRHTDACGSWMARASVAIHDRDASRLLACVVTTRLSADTAHVAQIVVDPACRGQGLAAHLLDVAAREAAQAGATRLTLLVADGNAGARALYDRLGFVERATFTFADRPRLARSALPRVIERETTLPVRRAAS